MPSLVSQIDNVNRAKRGNVLKYEDVPKSIP